jgi:hypothetical protein
MTELNHCAHGIAKLGAVDDEVPPLVDVIERFGDVGEQVIHSVTLPHEHTLIEHTFIVK